MALRYWADRWLDSFLNTLTLSQNCAAISSCRENCCIIFRSWKQCRWWTCCCSAKHRWIAATPVALRPCMRQQRMAMFQWCGSAVTSVKLVQRGYHGHHVIIACWLARCKSHNSSLGNGLHVFTGHTIQWGIYEFRRFCCVTGSFCWVRGLSWIAKGKALHLCTAQWEMGTKRHGLLPDLLLVLARKFRSATKGFEVSVVQKIGKISEMYFFVFFLVMPFTLLTCGTVLAHLRIFSEMCVCVSRNPETVLFEVGPNPTFVWNRESHALIVSCNAFKDQIKWCKQKEQTNPKLLQSYVHISSSHFSLVSCSVCCVREGGLYFVELSEAMELLLSAGAAVNQERTEHKGCWGGSHLCEIQAAKP